MPTNSYLSLLETGDNLLFMGKYIRALLQCLSVCSVVLLFPNLVPAQEKDLQDFIDKRIQRMTLDQKVGQLFIVGFPQAQLNKDLNDFIANNKPGSFILFKRNIKSLEQVRAFNENLIKISYKVTGLPPLIAVDQEGGNVSRLPISPPPPNALALGQTGSPLLAEEMGYQIGNFLREVGFNMNLAPVLDIVDPAGLSFIGVRSLGSDPQMVAEMGLSISKGFHRARVIPTAKHFPGTGSIIKDPHNMIVENNASATSLHERDLVPFKKFAELGPASAVMMSHIVYPALDSTREPASFSTKISSALLRDELQFKGLTITDDLQMKGSRLVLTPSEAALKALKSGSDMVMLTWSFKEQLAAFKRVRKAAESGELSSEDLNLKLRRILNAKAFANIYRKPASSPVMLGAHMTSSRYAELEDQVLSQNLKANISEQTPSPDGVSTPSNDKSPICLFSSSAAFTSSFVRASNIQVYPFLIGAKTQAQDIHRWIISKKCISGFYTVVGPATARTLKTLSAKAKKRLVVVNLGSPTLTATNKESYKKVLQLYFTHADAGKKIAQHISEILNGSNSSYAIK
ncbi:putative lipoprotein YbbD precursor [compost metagenome]